MRSELFQPLKWGFVGSREPPALQDSIMRLMALKEWRLRRFVEPRPTERTCQNWCTKGDVPAVRRGGLWFIDIDQEINQSGNELADAVLKAS